jgi:peroxiredoxin
MPSLQRLSEQFHAQDLQVLGISVDDDLNLVREFQLRHQIRFRLLSDRGQKLSRDVLQVPVFPMTYLVTRAGLVVRLIPGERDWMASSMLSDIEQLLAVRRQQPAAV